MNYANRNGDEFGLTAAVIGSKLRLIVAAYFLFLLYYLAGKTIGTGSVRFIRLVQLWCFSLAGGIAALFIFTFVLGLAFQNLFPGVINAGRGAYVWLVRGFMEQYLVYALCLWPIWAKIILKGPLFGKGYRRFSAASMFFSNLLIASILLAIFENPPLGKHSSIVLSVLLAGIGKLLYLSVFLYSLSLIKLRLQGAIKVNKESSILK
jgi:hypothetical protein